jgi:hypothetical protein
MPKLFLSRIFNWVTQAKVFSRPILLNCSRRVPCHHFFNVPLVRMSDVIRFKNRVCVLLCFSMQSGCSVSHIRLWLIVAYLSPVRGHSRHRLYLLGSHNFTCRLLQIHSNILYCFPRTLFTMYRKSILDMLEQYMSVSTSLILEWKSMWKSTIWKCIVLE